MTSSNSNPTIVELAEQIKLAATTIDGFLKEHSHDTPSFLASSPVDYPDSPELMGLRASLIQGATDILHLALGPLGFVRYQALTVCISRVEKQESVMRTLL
jgi:hypothetical protein